MRFLLLCDALDSTREDPPLQPLSNCSSSADCAIRSDNGVPFARPNALFNLSKLSVWWLRLDTAIERIKRFWLPLAVRLCPHRKRINISTVLAGQKFAIKEVDEGIWLVSFMHYDLGYLDLEQKTLQPLDNPFGTSLSPVS
jgi:hypothetical protein